MGGMNRVVEGLWGYLWERLMIDTNDVNELAIGIRL
jgi:hypothetical protein